jgi:hypothetical protein
LFQLRNNSAPHLACRKSNPQGDAVGLDYIALTGRGAVLRAESPTYPSPTAAPWVIKTTKNQLRINNYELRMKINPENHINLMKILVQTRGNNPENQINHINPDSDNIINY